MEEASVDVRMQPSLCSNVVSSPTTGAGSVIAARPRVDDRSAALHRSKRIESCYCRVPSTLRWPTNDKHDPVIASSLDLSLLPLPLRRSVRVGCFPRVRALEPPIASFASPIETIDYSAVTAPITMVAPLRITLFTRRGLSQHAQTAASLIQQSPAPSFW